MIISFKNKLNELPWGYFSISILLLLIGMVTLFSISYQQEPGMSNTFYKQGLFIIPALLLFFIVINTPRTIIHKYAYGAYLIGIIAVLLPYALPIRAGTHRWISFGFPFAIQPSEFVKIITIIAVARFLSDQSNKSMKYFASLIIPFLIVLIPTAIVLKQPDLGTAVVMITPIFPILYWSGARLYHLFLLIAPLLSVLTGFNSFSFTVWGISLGIILYMSKPKMIIGIVLYFSNIFLGLLSPIFWNLLNPYQQKRVLTLFEPNKDPYGAAYQIIQSITAIGSGGFLGKGWRAGTQTHLKFLPVQESDFILSVIGEELGFIVIAIILSLFGILIIKTIKFSAFSNDRFSGLVLIGIATILLSHVFVNTAMTVGLIPVKGLPLPFISAGGSFLLSSFLMIGLVMNLSKNHST
ncbi:MAG: rod shape-determining protein RodA [Candidatus Marinimicrobia bacterium]|jgi:rod shape determining protein RodA|nr:rod shape-determining protein RodA [Candidatus Neomarinimicrobiota bacterium]MBT3937117.1 rod shape-determining protein RodA [Candidatus Neomarinimicrobiota bacterium]MBT3962087.1 rod shape-determining protein RodA [Candidatus Neomarinimicrobiota bacterium]MBT4382455.1 rod shape-determining protein RodA [Candidatus Neomarinimicrobiota bacterium]MBT4636572.1 rod shape-determining protein RodA [Candidatus Neomarinimicrobiota bacterium]